MHRAIWVPSHRRLRLVRSHRMKAQRAQRAHSPAAGVDRNGRARAKRQARAVANALILRRMPARYPFFILRSVLL